MDFFDYFWAACVIEKENKDICLEGDVKNLISLHIFTKIGDTDFHLDLGSI